MKKSGQGSSHTSQPSQRSARGRRIDFVFVTALLEEQEALLEMLPGYQRLAPLAEDIYTYFQAEIPVTFPDHTTGSYQVLVMSLLGMGRVQAMAATKEALHSWYPRYVILVG